MRLANTVLQIMHVTVSNLNSSLNDAICLFYDQTCTIQTLTDCLVAENLQGLSYQGQNYFKNFKPPKALPCMLMQHTVYKIIALWPHLVLY